MPENSLDPPRKVLHSWKEIAAHLGRGVRTVQRWEQTEGLPVHRHEHSERASVYAYGDELDAWWQARKGTLAAASSADETDAPLSAAPVAEPAPAQNPHLGPPSARGGSSAFPRMVVLAGAAVVGLGVWVAAMSLPRSRSGEPMRRFTVVSADDPTIRLAPLHHYPMIAISSDGRLIAYAARDQQRRRLYLRRIDEFAARPLEDTDGAGMPFFSPDGAWLGYFAQGGLKKIAIAGGAPLAICKVSGHAATWGANGVIVIGGDPYVGLRVVSAAGGEPRELLPLRRDEGEVAHLWPRFLPDGEHLLYTAWLGGGFDYAPIYLYSLKTGERRRVASGSSPAYAATGHLLYARDNTLLQMRFDPRRPGPGVEVPALPGVAWGGLCGVSHFALAADGTLVYAGAVPEKGRGLYWAGADGKREPIIGERREYYHPRLSPDGRRLAVTILSEGRYSIWIGELADGSMRRLTAGPQRSVFAVWSPDGAWLAYAADGDGPYSVYRQRADGGSLPERLTTAKVPQNPLSWAPDGSGLLYQEWDPRTGLDVHWLALQPEIRAAPFLKTDAQEEAAQFSPDGRWVVYVSNQSGRREVFVSRFLQPEVSWQVSSDGGWGPHWSPRGDRIVYQQRGGLVAVRVQPGKIPQFGKPVPVLQVPLADGAFSHLTNYDVGREGDRFVVLLDEPDADKVPLHVITNWAQSLGQSPTGVAGHQGGSR